MNKKEREKEKERERQHFVGITGGWKKRGMKDDHNDDFKTYYRIYRSTKYCDFCGSKIGNVIDRDHHVPHSSKCLEHDHESGYIRGIVCHSCNSKKAWEDTLIRFVKSCGLSFSF